MPNDTIITGTRISKREIAEAFALVADSVFLRVLCGFSFANFAVTAFFKTINREGR